MFDVKCQNLMISQVRKMKNITAHNWLEQMTKSADKERYERCGSPHTVGEHLKPYSENHFRKHTSRQSRDIQEQEFNRISSRGPSLSQILAKELFHSGYARYEKAIEERRLVPGGFDQNKGPQAVHVTLVSPLDKKTNKQYKAPKHFYVSPRRDLRCGHGRRAEERQLEVRPHAQWQRYLFRHDLPRSTSRKSSNKIR